MTEAYKIPLVIGNTSNLKFRVSSISYKFLHDRVQQAAYSLIPKSQKIATHLKIGRSLRESIPQEALAENILDIVNQLNYGVDLLTQEEQYDLANLNLIAGRKAKNNTAFAAAAKYLNLGCKLLAIDSWFSQSDLTLSLYVETAEAEYLVGNFERSKQLANLVLEKAQNTLDKVKVYEVQIRSEIAQNHMIVAMDIGVIFLKLLGVKLPQKPTIVSVLIAAVQTKLTLGFKSIEDLANLPEMTDPYKLAAMQILTLINSAAAQAGSLYFPLLVMAIVRLSVKYGNSTQSVSGYCTYGAILCNTFGDIETGYRFGKLGLKLLDNISNSFDRISIYFLFNALILHFKESISPAIQFMQEGIQQGIQAGEKEFTSYLTSSQSHTLFLGGTNLDLDLVEQKLNINSQIADKLHVKFIFFSINIMRQATLNLLGKTVNSRLIGSAFDEETMLAQLGDNSTALSIFYFFKGFNNYLFENYQDTIQAACVVKEYEKNHPGLLFFSVNNFYHSLALLANYKNIALKERKQYLQTVTNNQKKMKLWAYHAPCNYQHKFDLVEAEKARTFAKNTLAADLYDKAIAGAKANNYTPEVAIANELAAKFYLELGKTTIAKTYMTEAYYGYITWCAYAKVRDLEERYPNLIIRIKNATPKSLDTTNTIAITASKTTTDSSSILDLASIVKSSEAIQSNIIIETLPRTLLHIILENAGAQFGSIILEKDGNLFIEAINTNEKDFLKSIPVESSQDIPQKIINYVARTQQTLVIKDAKLDPIYNQDPYIQTHQCKSILCLPIIYQAKCIGIFYLENNIATGAFTSKRLELLKILASQAAIALHNARLYATEQQKSQMLSKSLRQLEETQELLVQKAEDLEQALTKLQHTQTQLVHTEKISSLGQLVAGVAHEVNNPVGCINGNLSCIRQYIDDLLSLLDLYQKYLPSPPTEIAESIETIDLEYLLSDLPRMVTSMKLSTERIKDIMQSLRNFSRNDGSDKRATDIHEGIEATILILGHRLKANSTRPAIQIVKEYDKLPNLECYPGQLNQVFMNLLANAIDALDEANEGKKFDEINNIITIRTILENDWAIISIGDNGLGMPEEVRQKLFDAFFTTKPKGKGTGLGLSISFQIVVEKHGGTLECVSSPGNGATFIIRIPV